MLFLKNSIYFVVYKENSSLLYMYVHIRLRQCHMVRGLDKLRRNLEL